MLEIPIISVLVEQGAEFSQGLFGQSGGFVEQSLPIHLAQDEIGVVKRGNDLLQLFKFHGSVLAMASVGEEPVLIQLQGDGVFGGQ